MSKFNIPSDEEIRQAYEAEKAAEKAYKDKIKKYAKEQGITFKEAENRFLVMGDPANNNSNSKSGCLGVMVVMIIVASYILT